MLGAYLAGECRRSEKAALEKHLAACPDCAAELEELRRLDRVLDMWADEPAPAGMWEAVMAEVELAGRQGKQENVPVPFMEPGTRYGTANQGRKVKRTRPVLVLRDLAVAAAVSAVIFWGGGAWLDSSRMLAAGQGINGAVAAYTRATETVAATVVERAAGTAGDYTRQILFEEWEQDEMPESPGS